MSMKLTSLLAIGALTCSAMTAVAEEAAQEASRDAARDAAAESRDAAPMAMTESGKKCDHKKMMHDMKHGDRRPMMGHGMGPMMGQGMHRGSGYGRYPGAGPMGGPGMYGRQGPMGDMSGPQDSPYETTMSPPRGMMGHGPRPMMGRGMAQGMGQGMQGMQGMGPQAMGERLEALEQHLANIEKLLQQMVDLQQKQ